LRNPAKSRIKDYFAKHLFGVFLLRSLYEVHTNLLSFQKTHAKTLYLEISFKSAIYGNTEITALPGPYLSSTSGQS
jgi:hypothetical protein